MAKFGHPDQLKHMLNGVRKAVDSPRTPAHLKAHLQKRLSQTGKDSIKPLPKSPMFGGDEMAMNINPAHKGMFTAKAKAAGKSVQEYANEKADAGGVLGKEANFARMAKRHFKPLPKSQKKAPAKKNPFFGEV